jgi:hypothetical protein
VGWERVGRIGQRRGAGLGRGGVEGAVVRRLGELVLKGWPRLERKVDTAPHERTVVDQVGMNAGSDQGSDRHVVRLRSCGHGHSMVN